MHEYSIVQTLLERAQAEARARGATTIHRLSVRVGELSGVESALLATAYETFRTRTICERADLDLHVGPARWECPDCGSAIRRGDLLTCSVCGAPARLVQGDEIILDRIEMEVP